MKHLLILLLWVPSTAFSKTIFEPSLGLGVGAFTGSVTGSGTVTTGTKVELQTTNFSAGVRYGITRRYIHVTAVGELHYINSSGDAYTEDNLGNKTPISGELELDNGVKGNFGIGIGYEWNIPLRTYVILGFPFSSLEISYYFSDAILIGLRYNRMELGVAGSNLNANTYGVAVSFPFEFNYPDHWWRKTDWQ